MDGCGGAALQLDKKIKPLSHLAIHAIGGKLYGVTFREGIPDRP